MVAAAPSHPLARRRVLLPADFNGQDFIGFDEDLSIRRELDRFFARTRDRSQSGDAIRQYPDDQGSGGAGVGVSILPARTMQAEIQQGRLVAIPLHAPDLVRPLGSCIASGRSSTGRRSVFWSCCKKPRQPRRWGRDWRIRRRLRPSYGKKYKNSVEIDIRQVLDTLASDLLEPSWDEELATEPGNDSGTEKHQYHLLSGKTTPAGGVRRYGTRVNNTSRAAISSDYRWRFRLQSF